MWLSVLWGVGVGEKSTKNLKWALPHFPGHTSELHRTDVDATVTSEYQVH